ncbi:hypothetical protein O2K51_04885 [Apibacter raozihei]|uniref:hypothetical protein n=1 Tax=Apibacter raozihei TaxID=2500547 RepID=UPI000FE3BA22|nr:hypothetical protein [Apibacter raozihei]
MQKLTKGKITLLFLIILLLPLYLSSQTKIKVVDIENNLPIPNASIYDRLENLLGYTDDEGTLCLTSHQDKILIRADNFLAKSETVGNFDKTIYLFKDNSDKNSDPKALYFLKKMWENRNKNNPYFLPNYKFDSYVKFTLDVPSDSIKFIPDPKKKLDSLNNNIKKLLEKSKVFIGERTMVYEYDRRYGKKALVTAYKAGGFDKPEFFNIAISQSLVNDYPEILKPRELQSNVSRLVDSLYINSRKTYVVYTYSRGKSETQFYRNLTVFIDAESYALVKLIGNTSKVSNVYYEISYAPYKNIWYAETEYMKTEILSSSFIKKINKILPKGLHSITRLTTTATVESHFLNFRSPEIYTSKDFNGYEYEISKSVSHNVDEKISSLRTDSLTKKEENTYTELHRIFKEYKIEPKLRFLRSLTSGELELGPLSMDIYSLFSHNLYESFRYQLGGHTNYKFSKDVQLGAYIAKGTRDKEVKGGGEITFYINKKQGGELTIKAETDVLPIGRTKTKYLTPKDELSAKPNNIYNSNYFTYRKFELSYQQDFFKNIDITFSVDYQRQRANFDYMFKNYDPNAWFNYVNTAIRLRYAPNVKYIETVTGKSTLKDRPPYYYFTYSKSWNLFENSTATHRLYLSALYSFMSKWGTTEFIGNLGATFGDTPLMNTYEGMGVAKHGNSIWARFSVKGFQSFETMNPSTFFSDRFISFQFTHHLRPIRVNEFKSLYFALFYKGLLGGMSNKDYHSLFEFEVPRDYYQEVGFEANKLLLGFVGVGVYARLGAYKKRNLDQNLFVKLTLDL